MDVSRLNEVGFTAKIGLREGIESVYEDFLQNRDRYVAGTRVVHS